MLVLTCNNAHALLLTWSQNKVWLVIFARDLLSRFSRVKSHSRKLKPRILSVPMCTRRVNRGTTSNYSCPNSNRCLSASVPLTAIAQAIQEIEILRMHRQTNRRAVQDWERKQSLLLTPWVRSCIILSLAMTAYLFPHTWTMSSVDNSWHALSF